MMLIWAPYEQGINVGSGDSFCRKILKCRLLNRDSQNLNKAKWNVLARITERVQTCSTGEESGLRLATVKLGHGGLALAPTPKWWSMSSVAHHVAAPLFIISFEYLIAVYHECPSFFMLFLSFILSFFLRLGVLKIING